MSGLLSHEGAGESPPSGAATHYAQLLARLEELEGYSHVALHQFPKLERHLLCAEIRQSLNRIQRLAITAWKRYHKQSTLKDLDIEIEVLRGWIRKSLRLQYINAHRYQVWSEHIGQIGRMVGGWLKASHR
ncbi:diversity-generating retroelement protein Avd [Marinobacter sp.]|uniref:diversity-generating retroelement protein Avd n=1 Tax=Marinobacter sp. TaxID=50741 RepID=UPI003A8CC5DD